MKRNISTIVCAAVLAAAFLLPLPVKAQTSQDTLNQYVSDLQKNPGDNALREKIIKLAQEMTPAPVLPEEARRHFIMAQTYQKKAKNEVGYKLAIDEYKQALLLAPWLPEGYNNLGLLYEMAGKYEEASSTLKLYLLTNPPDAQSARDKITEIEATKNLASAEAAHQKSQEEETKRKAGNAKKQDDYETWLKNLDGARFIGPPMPNGAIGHERDTMYLVYYIEGNKVHAGWFDREPADFKTAAIRETVFVDGSRNISSVEIQGKTFLIPQPHFMDFRYDTATISDDGQFITFVHAKFAMKRVK